MYKNKCSSELNIADIIKNSDDDEQYFWSCPATGLDCRILEMPALAIILEPDGTSTFQMYSTWALASDAGEGLIECKPGMTSDFILDNLLHYAAKNWVDLADLLKAVEKIAWLYGNLSWAFCAGTGNPLVNGRPTKKTA